jgi:hypothetical protein
MQSPATDFMMRKASSFREWLTIGEPRTDARIEACIRRFSKQDAKKAIIETCMERAAKCHK